MPYKRAQIVHVLESLIEHENIRDVNAVTKRLVHRCLSGDWCVQFRKTKPKHQNSFSDTMSVSSADSLRSPALESISSEASPLAIHASGSNTLLAVSDTNNVKSKGTLKTSHSAENLRKLNRGVEAIRIGSNDSSTSLPRVAAASAGLPSGSGGSRRRERAGSMDVELPSSSISEPSERRPSILEDAPFTQEPPEIRVVASSPFSPTGPGIDHTRPGSSGSASSASSLPSSPVPKQRRTAPAPPPRRRKPPAVPVRNTTAAAVNGGVTITTIASSSSTTALPHSPRLNSPLGPSRSGVSSH